MVLVKLRKIKTVLCSKCVNQPIVKIKHNPYYIALKDNNNQLLHDFVSKLNVGHRFRPTATLDGLKQLQNTIKKEGFIFGDPTISIKPHGNNYICTRGRHRVCILYNLYGKNCKLKLKKNTIVKIIP